jgi:hypothetical protein
MEENKPEDSLVISSFNINLCASKGQSKHSNQENEPKERHRQLFAKNSHNSSQQHKRAKKDI